MGLRDSLRELVYGPPRKAWSPELVEKRLTATPDSLVGTLQRLTGAGVRTSVWRRVSIREALGVPAIHRAVALISSTTGMLSVQAYRNGALMADPPRIITRPDPYETPGAFYGGTASDMAKYGEFVWWIASKDADGLASALLRVPLTELQVQENPDNRLLPKYTWGTKTGFRYSGANPEGRFVHVKYPLAEPFALRGEGPLQLCGAANSIAVESQNWAGNFYGEGGQASTVIKKAGLLSPEKLDPTTMLPDVDGLSEAEILRNQVIGRSNNTAMVIDDGIESIDFKAPNTVGAQMLDARQFNNGDAAREFGIPGSLLEYQQPGSSLTYQNLEGEFTKLVRVTLQPLYLEPIEQAISDLLTRSTVARFNLKGFLRADIKTRFEVYGMAIDKGIYGPDYAQREEGIAPGDVEYAPVPFASPQAIPLPLPQYLSMRDVRCDQCHRLVVRAAGPVEGFCRHCKRTVTDGRELSSDAPAKSEIHVHLPEGMVHFENIIQPPAVTVSPPDVQVNVKQAAIPADTSVAEHISQTLLAIDERLSKPRKVSKEIIRDGSGVMLRVVEEETA